jgi:hypothetical protein
MEGNKGRPQEDGSLCYRSEVMTSCVWKTVCGRRRTLSNITTDTRILTDLKRT